MKQFNLLYIAFITGLVINIFKLPKNEIMLLKLRITFPVTAVPFHITSLHDASHCHADTRTELAAVEG